MNAELLMRWGVLAAAIILILVAVKLFYSPLKFLLKTGLNGLLGLTGLFMFNLAGSLTGVTIGINLINALIVGFLGVPGLISLLFVRVILR